MSWFKSAVVRAKSPNELHKAVDEALASGARLNAKIRKLKLYGAEFHDTLWENKLIGEIYNELQPEVQSQIDERLEELEKAEN